MNFPKSLNVKSDLFAAVFSFILLAVAKLGSSLILTRILLPEAYGVITILLSIAYVIDMIADTNVTLFIVRDKNAEDAKYLNTAWTMRLVRSVINAAIFLILGPLVATSFYHAPELGAPLRVFSAWFIIGGLESMSFQIAVRRKNARIMSYSELSATLIGTTFGILYCYYSRDYWGMIFATLITRLVLVILSYQFYKEFRPRLHFNFLAAREILAFTKFVMPSSLITLVLSQFDKVVFLRLFDLRLLGIYGFAGGIAGPIESLIIKISQTVMYPRCAHNFRLDPATVARKYYAENIKLFVAIMAPAAIILGAARMLITVLYPARYIEAAVVLKALMFRAVMLSLASPAEDLLVAVGEPKVILGGNILRALTVFSASLAGNYYFGFMGFVYGCALSGLPPLLYYFAIQQRKGLLNVRNEFYRVAFIVAVAVMAFMGSELFLAIFPAFRLRN